VTREAVDPAAVAEPARIGEPAEFDARPYLDGIGALLAGPANVIMQLALAPVGYGVFESKVDSGKVTKHPIKRFRTTFTYLSVAMLGSDAERAAYRDAVNGAHRFVRSDAASPVKYNAFDRDLQLWVAACLYYGSVDVYNRMHGPMADDEADAFYRYAARFGTTLQVPDHMWPADRATFARYWQDTLARVSIDPTIRGYLYDLVSRRHMPRALRGSARFNLFTTTGFLPPRFRDEMQLEWTDADERRFDRLLRRIGTWQRFAPGFLRRIPFNLFIWDLRFRIRFGRRLV
jgi:uncharacterized protein (DUF2236 family)